jgi:hypothetical protein
MDSLSDSSINDQSDDEHDLNQMGDGVEHIADEANPPARSNSIIDKKFMLVAKIKALEEYVEHLENTVTEQTSYIDSLEREKQETALRRCNSI